MSPDPQSSDPIPEPGPAQLPKIEHGSGPLLIEGGAGVGKSAALDARVAALVSGGLDPSRIAVITSTRNAAAEHRSRLEALLEPPYEELVVATWEDFAERLLRDWPAAAGLDPGFEVVGPAERLAMLLVRFDSLPLRHHQIRGNPTGLMTGLLRRIDRLKSDGVSADDLRAIAADEGEPDASRTLEVAELIEIHDRMLADLGSIDSNDACSLAAAMLAGHESVRQQVAAQFPHLVVDELEDLSPVRSELLAGLIGGAESLVAAADESRALAAPGAVDRFEAIAPGLVKVTAAESRRLGPDSVDAARAVLAGGGIAVAEDWHAGDGTTSVRFWRSGGAQAEAQAVAREVEHAVSEGAAPETIAITVKDLNRDGGLLASALAERGVPATVGGGAALFRQPEVRDTIAWLRGLTDPDDAPAVTRAITRPPIGLRSVDLAKLTVIARRRKLDMVSACDAALESPQISPEARQRIEAFLSLYRAAAGALDGHRPDVFVRRLIERVGFRRQRLFAAKPETAERLLGLSRLAEIATAWARRDPNGSTREFTKYLSALADTGLEVTGSRGAAVGSVQIVAYSEVKGRVWSRVYLTGLHRADDEDRRAIATAIASADDGVVLSRVETPAEGSSPSGPFEDAFKVVGGLEEVHEEELFGPAEDLHATYRMMRDEVLEASWKAGRELSEPRLDTAIDVNRAITRYLELLKLAALAQRPGGTVDSESIEAINGLLAQVATPEQLAELTTSTLDPYLLANERDRGLRQRLIDSKTEPSLAAFLPKRGGDLRLSASDVDLYLTCPLKYKFARVFGIPQAPTINQRFGILIHNVLQRFHDPKLTDTGDQGLDLLMSLLEQGWRRSGFGDSNDELQFKDRAYAAMENYWQTESASDSQPVWLERQFEFKIGPHYVRGRVDRVDRRGDGGYEVIDYKTGMKVNTERLGGDIQLAIYRIGAAEAWDLEVDNGSYYYVLDGEKVNIEAGPDEAERIDRTVREVGDGILSQDFEPRPSPGVCSWCDYRLVCPAAEA
ncbi:MAG: ATP-dependent helicase [Thermoleophilia bacterium]|nr:ATP-dependent helicase [Thermoleophilia bacterium]